MKVILLQDVKGTGKSGAVVEVSDGFARNLPHSQEAGQGSDRRRRARRADGRGRRKAPPRRGRQGSQGAGRADRRQTGDRARQVRRGRPALWGDHLEGSGRRHERAVRHGVRQKKVELPGGNIKELGEYDVVVRVYAETAAKIKVKVERL